MAWNGHLWKITGQPSRQLVPSFEARISACFAYMEAPDDFSRTYKRNWSFRANGGFSLYGELICWKLSTKVQTIWCDTCIIMIKLLVERHKKLYSASSGNNWCPFFAKIYLGRALIHEFLSWCIPYYDMKCSTDNEMGEYHYSFYVVCCNSCS